ncbi:MAG: ribonuclease H-like domain-containing protein [Alphaproteobacteria bacterium]|nr:ribonuclease H-like domain-containing protein [Alphaproteobacteria bacterium]
MVTVVIARDQDSPTHLHPMVGETGYLGAIALATANLRLGQGDAKLDFSEIFGLSANGFFAPHEEAISLDREIDLLRVVTRWFEDLPSPLLLTWKGAEFDIPFLQFRALAANTPAKWLLTASQPDTEDLFTTGHVDLCRYLRFQTLSMSLDQALCEIGFQRDPTIRGLARLELTASGLLLLAANAFSLRGAISENVFNNFVDSFQVRARQFSVTRSHFGFYAADEAAKNG